MSFLVLVILTGCLGDIGNFIPDDNDDQIEVEEEGQEVGEEDSDTEDIQDYQNTDRVEYVDHVSWLVVDPSNSLNYNYIQEAVDDANDHYKILIEDGLYEESIHIDEKDIELLAIGDAVIQPGFNDDYGIKIEESNVEISGLKIDGFENGIYIDNRFEDTHIYDMTIVNTGYGIRGVSGYLETIIEDVYISNSSIYGISTSSSSLMDFYFRNINIKDSYNAMRINSDRFYDDRIDNVDITGNENGIRFFVDSTDTLTGVKYESTDNYIRGMRSSSCDNCDEEFPEYNDYVQDKTSEYIDKEPPKIHEIDYGITGSDFMNMSDNFSEDDVIELYEDIDLEGTEIELEKDLNIINPLDDKVVIEGHGGINCITVSEESKVKFSGNIIIDNCISGINFNSNNKDFVVDGLTFRNTQYGINAVDSTGDWRATNLNLRFSSYGLYVIGSSGNWEVINSHFDDLETHVDASSSTGLIRFSSFEEYEDFHLKATNSDLVIEESYFEGSSSVRSGSTVDINNRCSLVDCSDKLD